MKNLITVFLLALLSTSALAIKMPSLPGTDSKEEASSSQSAADAQEAIVGDFKVALGLVLQAQGHVAAALGMGDTAESLRAEAGRLSGDDCAQSCLEEVTEASANGEQKIQEQMEAGSDLDAASKKELVKAYPPLGKGTLRMSKLAPKAKDWAKSASSEIKAAGMMGAAKMKKKLGVGLYIASATPKLIKEWTKTTSAMISFGKKAGVSTEGASGDEMEG
ncbi:hypothetical protein N9B97_01785 [Porticoccaceae bacterium]|nr:hypothetical protein [Porticoccaceae bacterium]